MKRMWPRGRGRADRLQKRSATSRWSSTRSGAGGGEGEMGQKVNPTACGSGSTRPGCRAGSSIRKQYADTLHEDLRLRRTIMAAEETQGADIAEVEIVRHPQRVTVIIHTGRPGVLIGAKGANIEKLGGTLQKLIGKKIQLQDQGDQAARDQREARRRERRPAAEGARLLPPGHEDGHLQRDEGRRAGHQDQDVRPPRTARRSPAREEFKEGRVPLHTFRADIDYNTATADHHLRLHRHQGLGLQRRGLRQREEGGRRPARARGHEGRDGRDEREARRPRPRPAGSGVAHAQLRSGPSTASSSAARMKGKATRNVEISFGDFGLMALEQAWITNRQIEAARIAITRHVKRGGKVWIRIFPDKPYTKKPAETRMGKGKGAPEYWVAPVKPGTVLFELGGVDRADRRGGHARWPGASCRSRRSSSRARRSEGDEEFVQGADPRGAAVKREELAQAVRRPPLQRSSGTSTTRSRSARCAGASRASPRSSTSTSWGSASGRRA